MKYASLSFGISRGTPTPEFKQGDSMNQRQLCCIFQSETSKKRPSVSGTLQEMTQTLLDFETELYQEHFEEASFLYEQHLTLRKSPHASTSSFAS
jgi:hypothetical protein